MEHQQVTEDLYRLDEMSLAKFPVQFEQCLAKIMSELTEHIAEEEAELLPSLEKVCSRDELIEMGRKFETTTVTTRPHPWVRAPHNRAQTAHHYARLSRQAATLTLTSYVCTDWRMPVSGSA